MEGFEQLKSAGVPFGTIAVTTMKPIDWALAARRAGELLATKDLPERESLALLAWLSAMQTHFPTRAKALGLTQSFQRPKDGRWLKLRRIAIARLAQLI